VGDGALGDHIAGRILSRAYETLKGGDEIRSEIAWMAGAARRELAEWRRAAGRTVRLEGVGDRVGPTPEPYEQFAREDLRAAVRAAIAALPETCRLALELRYVEGCSEAETVERMEKGLGIGREGTRSALRRGRRMCERALMKLVPRAVLDRRRRPRRESNKNS
jgi:DNA-directed RNA polymerase specialized sigma24 family protein